MSEMTMNPVQRQAIESVAGAMQVLAGPGSGKTFVLTRRIRYLVEQCEVEPTRILVITFTKAAALEMKQRFSLLQKGCFLPVRFGTFHAIFYHILKQQRQYRTYSLITESEKRKLLLHILQMPLSVIHTGNEKVEYLLGAISFLKNNGENFAEVPDGPFAIEEMRGIYQKYNGFMEEFHKLDFDDMALLCLKIFRESPETLSLWQHQYQYIMIDEFQDINPIQYEIVKCLAAVHRNLFVVGDDDQSIYGFRGAKPEIMKRFMADFPRADQLLLDINYRCHEQIVEDSLKVIACNQNRFDKVIHAAHTDGRGVIIHAFEEQEEEEETLVKELKALTEKTKPECLGNTAVIYRTNYECGLLAEKLFIQQIPFIMRETLRSRYDHFVVKDLLAYMSFANGEKSRDTFCLFMNRPLRYLRKECVGHNPVQLSKLLAYYQNEPPMQETVRKLFCDIEKISAMRPYLAIRYIRRVIGYDDYIKENYDKESAEKLFRIADDFQALSKSYDSLEKLSDYISQYNERIRQKREMSDKEEKMQTGIRLLTMHASKGLEFDTVYLPDINEGKVPSRQSVSEEAIEEERRMFYVAMTRAKRELHILYCTKKARVSRFLEPLL